MEQIPRRHQLAEPHAADYWNEHRENFAKMLKELMLEETLRSVLGEASKTSLKWNHVKVSRAYFLPLLIRSRKLLIRSTTKTSSSRRTLLIFPALTPPQVQATVRYCHQGFHSQVHD